MGASKNFFTDLREGEQFANVSMRMELYNFLCAECIREVDFTLNKISTKTEKYKGDETWEGLTKDISKLKKKQIKREQEILGNIK